MKELLKKIVDAIPVLRKLNEYRIARIIRKRKELAIRLLRKHGPEIYCRVDDLMRARNVQYFADYGSLLGLVRDKGFVATDDDVDFSVVNNSLPPKELIRYFIGNGFEYLRAFKYNGKITEVSLAYKGVPVDFFYLQYENGENYAQAYYWSNEYEGWRGLRQLRDRVTKLCTYELPGIKTMIPENYDALLTGHYGDWRVPNSAWNYKTDAQEKVNIRLSDYAYVLDSEEIDRICAE